MDPIDKFLKQYSYKFPLGSIDIYDDATIQLINLTISYSMQNVNSYYGNNSFTYYASTQFLCTKSS